MKKQFIANWQGEEMPVTIDTGQGGEAGPHVPALLVRCGEKRVILDVARTAPNRYLVLHEGQVHDLVFSHHQDDVTASVAGGVITFGIEDEKARRRVGHAGPQGAKGGKIVSPMPGKVVKVLVKAGQTVKNGEGLVVVEAMKMENEFKAHANGIVKTVHVKTGDTVEGGQILLEMEIP